MSDPATAAKSPVRPGVIVGVLLMPDHRLRTQLSKQKPRLSGAFKLRD
jgi:hypothetical protein